MGFKKVVVERTRKNFIKLCTDADVPRMAAEVYPEDVNAVRGISYIPDDNEYHRLDIYFPKGVSFENQERKKAVLDIHGGGFVYGLKEINMCFNMNVAKLTKTPVVSVNYTICPEGSLVNMVKELATAVEFLKETYGIEELVLMGDSAGGFLAFTLWAVLTDKDIRHEYQCFKHIKIDISGLILICPAVTDSQRIIAGLEEVYFPNEPHSHIPKYARDLTCVLEMAKFLPPKTLLITSDKDSMHEETLKLKAAMEEKDIDLRFFDGKTKEGGNPLYHVYVVTHSEWPESQKPLSMIADIVIQ